MPREFRQDALAGHACVWVALMRPGSAPVSDGRARPSLAGALARRLRSPRRALLAIAVVAFVASNLLAVVIALAGALIAVVSGWWVLTERMPRRGVGAAGLGSPPRYLSRWRYSLPVMMASRLWCDWRSRRVCWPSHPARRASRSARILPRLPGHETHRSDSPATSGAHLQPLVRRGQGRESSARSTWRRRSVSRRCFSIAVSTSNSSLAIPSRAGLIALGWRVATQCC